MRLTLLNPAAGRRPHGTAGLSRAGFGFIAVGALLSLGAAGVHPAANADVLCCGVTLAVAGAVLRGLSSPQRD